MKIPKAIEDLTVSFEKLPGIGPKSAQRLTFYLLHVPQYELDNFASSLSNLKKNTVICSVCFMVGETDPCDICSNTSRDPSIICVVEETLDVLALEKNKKYNGLYHVLNGRIDPLNNIGPDEIFIPQLLKRLREGKVSEVILATNPTMEGEGTAMYISKQIRSEGLTPKITRIGRGLPIGSDLEYADEVTLQKAMEGRQEF
jgi:recombination protein RecR